MSEVRRQSVSGLLTSCQMELDRVWMVLRKKYGSVCKGNRLGQAGHAVLSAALQSFRLRVTVVLFDVLLCPGVQDIIFKLLETNGLLSLMGVSAQLRRAELHMASLRAFGLPISLPAPLVHFNGSYEFTSQTYFAGGPNLYEVDYDDTLCARGPVSYVLLLEGSSMRFAILGRIAPCDFSAKEYFISGTWRLRPAFRTREDNNARPSFRFREGRDDRSSCKNGNIPQRRPRIELRVRRAFIRYPVTGSQKQRNWRDITFDYFLALHVTIDGVGLMCDSLLGAPPNRHLSPMDKEQIANVKTHRLLKRSQEVTSSELDPPDLSGSPCDGSMFSEEPSKTSRKLCAPLTYIN